MTTVRLNDFQWTKIRSFLKADRNAYIGNEAKCRRFVGAVLWMSRSGLQWRLLPSEYGKWNSVYKRFALAGGRSSKLRAVAASQSPRAALPTVPLSIICTGCGQAAKAIQALSLYETAELIVNCERLILNG